MKNIAIMVLFPMVACAAFDDNTIAFYPFKDGEVGSSALTTGVKNALDAAKFAGTFEGEGSVTFSDERPGDYLFTNFNYGASCVYEKPGSLYFAPDADKKNGVKLSFADIVNKLVEIGAGAGNAIDAEKWTIEFFYKFDNKCDIPTDTKYTEYRDFLTLTNIIENATYKNCNFGLGFLSTGYRRFNCGVSGVQSDGTYKEHAYMENSANIEPYLTHKSGTWHYLSISSGLGTSGRFCVGRPDYYISHQSTESQTKNETAKMIGMKNNAFVYRVIGEDEHLPLIFNGAGSFCGWISCLRIRKGGVMADELRASVDATCLPQEIARIRFEDAALGPVTEVANDTKNYFSDNPQMYNWASVLGKDNGAYGAVTVYTPTTLDAPTFSDVVHKKYAKANATDKTPVANHSSVAFVSPTVDPVTEAKGTVGCGILLDNADLPPLLPNQPYTVEFFYKFDLEGWKAHAGNTQYAKRVALAWSTYADDAFKGTTSYSHNWICTIDVTDETKPKLRVEGFGDEDPLLTSVKLVDGKWHHIAIAIDPSGSDTLLNAYFDYRQVDERTAADVKGKIKNYNKDNQPLRHLWFARDNANTALSDNRVQSRLRQAFEGNLDEIRVSYGVLGPDDFLRQTNAEGLMLILR